LTPSTLEPKKSLARGDSLVSANRKFELTLLDSGSLVLYELPKRIPVWSAPIVGFACTMRADGNLVVLDEKAAVVWASNTSGHPNASLVVHNEGFLIIRHLGKQIWATPGRRR
jgi:hypothetical protein